MSSRYGGGETNVRAARTAFTDFVGHSISNRLFDLPIFKPSPFGGFRTEISQLKGSRSPHRLRRLKSRMVFNSAASSILGDERTQRLVLVSGGILASYWQKLKLFSFLAVFVLGRTITSAVKKKSLLLAFLPLPSSPSW